MESLNGLVALVTGGSRGIGKGVASRCCDAGALVHVTGRTVDQAGLGDGCIPVVCDHTDDGAVQSAFERIASAKRGQLDLLVNNAWGGYERMVEDGASPGLGHSGNSRPGGGTQCRLSRGCAPTTSRAARGASMVERRRGLIVQHLLTGRAQTHRE